MKPPLPADLRQAIEEAAENKGRVNYVTDFFGEPVRVLSSDFIKGAEALYALMEERKEQKTKPRFLKRMFFANPDAPSEELIINDTTKAQLTRYGFTIQKTDFPESLAELERNRESPSFPFDETEWYEALDNAADDQAYDYDFIESGYPHKAAKASFITGAKWAWMKVRSYAQSLKDTSESESPKPVNPLRSYMTQREREQETRIAELEAELADKTRQYEFRVMEWAAVKHDLLEQVRVMREALEEISGSIKWGKDTAIKREISQLQDIASQALASLEGTPLEPEVVEALSEYGKVSLERGLADAKAGRVKERGSFGQYVDEDDEEDI